MRPPDRLPSFRLRDKLAEPDPLGLTVRAGPVRPDCWWSWQGCTTPNAALGIPADLTILPEPNTIGLTLDDGPNCSQNALFEYLRQQNQKVSLYYIGSNVLGWPSRPSGLSRTGTRSASTLGLTSTFARSATGRTVADPVRPMTTLSNEVAFAELYYTQQIIKEVLV